MVRIFSITNCDSGFLHPFPVEEILVDESTSDIPIQDYFNLQNSKYWIKALKHIDSLDLNEPVLILTCVKTSVSYDELKSLLKSLDKVKHDICYLGYWMEKCHKLDVIKKHKDYEICDAVAPNGIVALYIKPKIVKVLCGRAELRDGRKITPLQKSLSSTLRDEIDNKMIKAIIVYPPPFHLSLSSNLRKIDYLKLNPCSYEAISQEKSGTHLSIFWYLGIVVGLFIIFALIILVEKYKYADEHPKLFF